MENITHMYSGTKMADLHVKTFAKYGIPISLHAQNDNLFLFFETETERQTYISKLKQIQSDLKACDPAHEKINIQETITFVNVVIKLLNTM